MTPTTAAQPASPLPIDPGDECLCTWPNGESECVHVVMFRADGRADITFQTREGTEHATVPRDFLTRLPY